MSHISVLLQETLEYLLPDGRPISRMIDGTLGAGGHSRAFLERGVQTILGLDLDRQAIDIATEVLAPYGQRIHIVQDSYANMTQHARDIGWDSVDVILLDLGVSSMQLDTPERGFAFRFDAPLDMRFIVDGRPSAADIVNSWHVDDLADIFYKYGEESNGRWFAKAIVAHRPVLTTQQLADVIQQATPKNFRKDKKTIHPATKVFQALRIAVNDELRVIETTLPLAIQLLKPHGRMGVISFHSLEDGLVKSIFKEASTEVITPPGMASIQAKKAIVEWVAKKPIEPSPDEQTQNPRSRSAKLRVIEKL